MSAVDNGSQLLFWDYKNPVTSESFNRVLKNLAEPGIYVGGNLSNLGNIVSINPFSAFIDTTDGLRTVRVQTQDIATVDATGQGDSSNPAYLFMTLTWQNVEDNYLDFGFRAISAPAVPYEIILGTVFFDSSGNVTSVTNSSQTRPNLGADNTSYQFLVGSVPVSAGDVVRIEPNSLDKVIPAQANSPVNVAGIVGIAKESGSPNDSIRVVVSGKIFARTDDTWNSSDSGKLLYLSATSPGKVSTSFPSNAGEFIVRIGFLIDFLTDTVHLKLDYPIEITNSGLPFNVDADLIQGIPVSNTPPNDGETLIYNATSGVYELAIPSGGSGGVSQAEFDNLLYNVVMGAVPNWNMAVVVGSGTSEEPDSITYTDSVNGHIIRLTFTWGTFGPTIIVYELSLNGTNPFSTLGTETITYDGSGNVTNIVWS